MADQTSRDVLMSVTLKGKALALKGESGTRIDTSDVTMLEGFFNAAGRAQGGADANLFCEIQEFKFGVGVEDSDTSQGNEQASSAAVGALENALHDMRASGGGKEGKGGKEVKGAPGGSRKKAKQFGHFMQYGGADADPSTGSLAYDVSLDPISITRQMDQMSTVLLNECLNRRPLKRIIVVKRKFTGNMDFHEAYLRLEFIDCLITTIDWDDDDSMKEEMKFVYRELKASYKPQKNDGTLGSVLSMNFKYDPET